MREFGIEALIVGLLRKQDGRRLAELYDPKTGKYTSPAVRIANFIDRRLDEVENCLAGERFWQRQEHGRIVLVGLGSKKRKANPVSVRRVEAPVVRESERVVLNLRRDDIARVINIVLAFVKANVSECEGPCKHHESLNRHARIAHNSLSALVSELQPDLSDSQAQKIAGIMVKLGAARNYPNWGGKFLQYVILGVPEVTEEMLREPIKLIVPEKSSPTGASDEPVVQIIKLINSLESQLEEAKQQLETANQQNVQLRQRNTSLEAEGAQLREKVEQLEGQVKTLKAQIEELAPLAEMAQQLNELLDRRKK